MREVVSPLKEKTAEKQKQGLVRKVVEEDSNRQTVKMESMKADVFATID